MNCWQELKLQIITADDNQVLLFKDFKVTDF